MDFCNVSDALKYLVQQYGADILKDAPRFVAMFADLMPGAETERRLLRVACESGVYSRCISAAENERQECVTKSIHKLVSFYAIAPAWAEAIMAWLCDALSFKVDCTAPTECLSAENEVSQETALDGKSNISLAAEVGPLLQRALLFAEDGEWKSADEYCERALDENPSNAEAYLIKLLIEHKAHSFEELNDAQHPLSGSTLFAKIERFGSTELVRQLRQINQVVIARNEEEKNSEIYRKARKLFDDATSAKEIDEARSLFLTLGSYHDAAVLADRCQTEWKGREQQIRENLQKLCALEEGPARTAALKKEIYAAAAELTTLEDACRRVTAGLERKPQLEAEKDDVSRRVSEKRTECAGLSMFAGKRKRELTSEIELLEQQLEKTKQALNIIKADVSKYGTPDEIRKKIALLQAKKVNAKQQLATDEATIAKEQGNYMAIKDSVLSEKSLEILSGSPDAVKSLSRYPKAVKYLIRVPTALPTMTRTAEAQKIIGGDPALIEALPLPYRLRYTDIFELGSYAQSGPRPAPLRWRVLRRNADYVLAICERCIAYQQMSEIAFMYSWSNSEIRKWLNYTFLDEAFTQDEQRLILSVSNPNPHNYEQNTAGEKNTVDKVFLLSMDEVKSYFRSDADRLVRPTMNVFRLLHYSSGPEQPIEWWLRTPGKAMPGTTFALGAATVSSQGFVSAYGDDADAHNGIRPAICVQMY